jgi:hypothetical protein
VYDTVQFNVFDADEVFGKITTSKAGDAGQQNSQRIPQTTRFSYVLNTVFSISARYFDTQTPLTFR